MSASGSALAHCLSVLNLLPVCPKSPARRDDGAAEASVEGLRGASRRGHDRALGLAALAPEPLAGLGLR